jgi:hypothetical protein
LGEQDFLIKAPVTLTFDPVTSKSLGVIDLSRLTSMQNMKTVGQRNHKILGRQAFFNQGPVAFTLNPVTSKLIGVIYSS